MKAAKWLGGVVASGSAPAVLGLVRHVEPVVARQPGQVLADRHCRVCGYHVCGCVQPAVESAFGVAPAAVRPAWPWTPGWAPAVGDMWVWRESVAAAYGVPGLVGNRLVVTAVGTDVSGNPAVFEGDKTTTLSVLEAHADLIPVGSRWRYKPGDFCAGAERTVRGPHGVHGVEFEEASSLVGNAGVRRFLNMAADLLVRAERIA